MQRVIDIPRFTDTRRLSRPRRDCSSQTTAIAENGSQVLFPAF